MAPPWRGHSPAEAKNENPSESTLACGLLLASTALLGCDGGGSVPAPLVDEAGFIEIEPVGMSEWTQRLWYVFQAADQDAESKPLVVFFNGGPGSTTEILLGFNTAKRTVDQARTNGAAVAVNPASWSRFANLLYLDAPNTGFSYALPGDASKPQKYSSFQPAQLRRRPRRGAVRPRADPVPRQPSRAHGKPGRPRRGELRRCSRDHDASSDPRPTAPRDDRPDVSRPLARRRDRSSLSVDFSLVRGRSRPRSHRGSSARRC